MVLIKIGDFETYIARGLRNHWQKNSLEHLKKTRQDRVYLVDGGEGTGKSTFAIQQMAEIEPSVFETPEKFVSRIAFTPEQFLSTVNSTKNGVVIFDEAFRGFSSRSALSKINKLLVQCLMEMRQQNNIVFIVIPSFFILDIYPAMVRSAGLFNIYINKTSGRRVWQGYSKDDKNKIYQVGLKRGWSYPFRSNFRGHYFGKFPIDVGKNDLYEKTYLDKKAKAFKDMHPVEVEEKPVEKKESEVDLLRKAMVKLESEGLNRREIARKLNISIYRIVREFQMMTDAGIYSAPWVKFAKKVVEEGSAPEVA